MEGIKTVAEYFLLMSIPILTLVSARSIEAHFVLIRYVFFYSFFPTFAIYFPLKILIEDPEINYCKIEEEIK